MGSVVKSRPKLRGVAGGAEGQLLVALLSGAPLADTRTAAPSAISLALLQGWGVAKGSSLPVRGR